MDNFNIKKFFKDQYITEGSCGYTPDGKPRSKPAGPDLMKEKICIAICKITFNKVCLGWCNAKCCS